MNKNTISFDEGMVEVFKEDPKGLKDFIKLSLEDYEKDGDEKILLRSLNIAIKASGGYTKLSRETGLSREALYKAFSPSGNPKFSTFVAVINNLGLHLELR